MTRLQMRMIEDMKLAGLAAGTEATYIDAVRKLAAHHRRSLDQLGEEEVRCSSLIYVSEGAARGTFKANHHGIHFFYRQTLNRDWALFAKKRFAGRSRSACPIMPLPMPRSAACLAA